jgi:predicted DNA-binding transcriptional regulator AlpA
MTSFQPMIRQLEQPQPIEDRFLRASEVQRELGISRATAYRMMTDGTLPVYRFSGQRGRRMMVRVSSKDLREWREARKAQPQNTESKVAPAVVAGRRCDDMNSQLVREVLDMIDADVRSRPSAAEFEMAYQARVAIDRIRFAIKQTEQAGGRVEQIREAGMELLDALDRLESVDRRFQQRSRCIRPDRNPHRTEPSNPSDITRSSAKPSF